MTDPSPSLRGPQIHLAPNEILIKIVHALNGRVDNLAQNTDAHTTCCKALAHVQSLILDYDRPLTLVPVLSRAEKQKLKELALAAVHPDKSFGPLNIVNAVPAIQLPSPTRATEEERKILKKNFSIKDAMKSPYFMTYASAEDNKLPTISGEIVLSAINGEEKHPSVRVYHDHCLWDSGAHYCSMSSDLVTKTHASFLDLDVHEPYRMRNKVGVQVDALFCVSNTVFRIATIFIVLPVSEMPNGRSGIILGQHRFMDRLLVESIPRSILLRQGKQTDETLWGAIHIKALLNVFDELVEF